MTSQPALELPDTWVVIRAADLRAAKAGAGPETASALVPETASVSGPEVEPAPGPEAGPQSGRDTAGESPTGGPARALAAVAAEAGETAFAACTYLLEDAHADERGASGVVVVQCALTQVLRTEGAAAGASQSPGEGAGMRRDTEPIAVLTAGWAPYGAEAVRSTLLLRFCPVRELPDVLAALTPGGGAQGAMSVGSWVVGGTALKPQVSRTENRTDLVRRLRIEITEALAHTEALARTEAHARPPTAPAPKAAADTSHPPASPAPEASHLPRTGAQ